MFEAPDVPASQIIKRTVLSALRQIDREKPSFYEQVTIVNDSFFVFPS
jgi:hypothetical protein